MCYEFYEVLLNYTKYRVSVTMNTKKTHTTIAMMHVVCGTYVPGLAYKKRARVKGQQYPDRHE